MADTTLGKVRKNHVCFFEFCVYLNKYINNHNKMYQQLRLKRMISLDQAFVDAVIIALLMLNKAL